MISDTKSALAVIKDLIKGGSFKDALLQCKDLLRTSPDSFEGNVYAPALCLRSPHYQADACREVLYICFMYVSSAGTRGSVLVSSIYIKRCAMACAVIVFMPSMPFHCRHARNS